MLLDSIGSGDLDEYRLIRTLGQGAMGQVYLGHDTVLDRPVAIKLLNAASPSAEARLRFLIEARAIARLSHPNVVTVFRVGEHQDTPYLVSEYVRGTSLDQLDKPLSWERVLDIAIDLSRGLAAAHRRGVLHRDIKPANAMLSSDGTVKLLDFGLAKLAPENPALASEPAVRHVTAEIVGRLSARPASEPGAAAERPADDDDAATVGLAETSDGPLDETAGLAETSDEPLDETSGLAETMASSRARPEVTAVPRLRDPEPDPGRSPRLTATGALLGTPLYMAPEIWRGEEARAESDIYSLGALLYELACGQPPHMASNASQLERVVCDTDAAALRERSPAFEPRLAALIDQCLRRQHDERPGSADELSQHLESLASGVRASVPAGANPYRGLHVFSAEHRAFFFGRGLDIRAIADTLRAESLVVVAGDSGVGKSSVCRAGVLPSVLAGDLGGERKYSAQVMVPGRRPMDTLLELLAPITDTSASSLLEEFRAQPQELGRRVTRALGPQRGLALFVDQFEELLTQSEREQAELFAEAITQLASASAGVMSGVRILVTARGDFLTRLSALPGLSQALNRGVYLLRPLSIDDLRQVIVGPARAMGVSFETEAMVEELAREAAEHDSGLPLLSFALHELWQARDRDEKMIPAAALEEIGGVVGALTRHADQVLENFRPAERRAAQRLLTAMVSAQGMNVRRHREELLADGRDERDPGRTERALDSLVKARLVLAREADDGDTTYELAHEALARSWQTLREWLDEDRDQRAVRERLLAAAAEWQRLDEPRDALWRGRQLLEVQAVGLDRSELSERAARFLGASQRFERRQRRMRWAAIAAVPVVIALIYGFFAGRAWLERERTIERYLEAAEAAKQVADEERREYQALHDRALAHLDVGELIEGTEIWAETRRRADHVINAYQVAVTELSEAILVDDRRAVRRPLVDALYAQMQVADSVFQYDRRDAFRDRLLTYDDGTVGRKLRAPASLSVSTSPAGASIRVQRYRREGVHRVLEQVLTWDGSLQMYELEPGSYLVEGLQPGYVPVRYPVVLGAAETHEVHLQLPPADSVPTGFVYIPPGRSLFGSDLYDNKNYFDLATFPLHNTHTAAFLIGRTEVTMAEWMVFLRALPDDEREQRRPQTRGVELVLQEDGVYEYRFSALGEHEYRVREGEVFRYQKRERRAEQDWRQFPVTGVSWDDARAYASWLDRTGRVPRARLCTEYEWERAARGADDRRFPHGDELQPEDANHDATYGREPLAFGPDAVGSYPISNSPFGVSDMAGNVWEWVYSNDKSGNQVVYRGGSFLQLARNSLVYNRNPGAYPSLRSARTGVRVCATW